MKRYPVICLAHGHEYIFVYPAEIIRIQVDHNDVNVHLNNGRCITVAKNLKDLEEILPSDIFIRSHHSAIVNLMYVTKFKHGDESSIELRNGTIVPLSRRKKSAFLSKFTKL